MHGLAAKTNDFKCACAYTRIEAAKPKRKTLCVCVSDDQVESIKMQTVKMKTTKGAWTKKQQQAVKSMKQRMENKMSR